MTTTPVGTTEANDMLSSASPLAVVYVRVARRAVDRGSASRRAALAKDISGVKFPSHERDSGFPRASPEEMEAASRRSVSAHSRSPVNDIEHMEGAVIRASRWIKNLLHPGAKVERRSRTLNARGRTSSGSCRRGSRRVIVRTARTSRSPGRASARRLSEQQIYDYGLNFIRTQLATVQGARSRPLRGTPRQILVDLDPGDVREGLSGTGVGLRGERAELILHRGRTDQ